MLSLRDIRVRADQQVLLFVASLSIGPGDRIVVMGPSGAGKSMLLSVITNRIPAGLTLSGHREADAGLSRMGFVPQRGLDALHPLIPVRRQLARVTGSSPSRVSEVLSQTGLRDERTHLRRPAELSGGQAQRVALAQAVLCGESLVVADEPTSALHPQTRDETLAMLERLVPKSAALIVSTHDPAVARALEARLVRIEDGVVTEQELAA